MIRTAVLVSVAAMGLGGAAGAADLEKGKASYDVCAACHGPEGAGSKDLNAPAIAGMPAWYTASQLKNFKAGLRGADAKDVYGTQMRPMSMTLPDDAAVENVSAFVASLPAPAVKPTLEGDLEKGKALYATCAACHGPDGSGMEALKAPPLTGQHDWYIERQLLNYKAGLRGADPKDAAGAQMRAMAATLATDEAVRDVSAYIATLD